MKLYRIAAIVLVMALAASLAGCFDASYFFSFKEEQATSNIDGSWLIEGEGVGGINEFGYYANGLWLTAPYMFSGDFTVTANIWLGMTPEVPADPEHPEIPAQPDKSGFLEIALTNAPPYSETPTDQISIQMRDLALDTENAYAIDWHDGSTPSEPLGAEGLLGEVPGLDKTLWNRLVLKKKGSNIHVEIDGRTVTRFDIVNYASEYMMISILSGCNFIDDPVAPKSGFIVKDFKVEFMEGNSQGISG